MDDGLEDGMMSHEMLASGLTQSQLARLFKTNLVNVQRKIAGVQPLTYRSKKPVYDIADVAPHLVKPAIDIEDILKNMKPADMPAALQKDYWGAQTLRQQYEERAAKLWKTERVQGAFGEVFKAIRQQIMLFNDTVEQQSVLTPEQRTILTGLSDGLLENCRIAIIDLFQKGYDPAGERDEAFENGPPKAPLHREPDDIDDGMMYGM